LSKPLGELSTREKTFSPPIKEIILENFMSYEYARIPLTGGLNLIVGPNGAGKSSVLLAISVAFGQAYTERSRKLSDLIRRGKDIARVSLIFDNRETKGKEAHPLLQVRHFHALALPQEGRLVLVRGGLQGD
jgi:chromosome segregation ATPase